MRHHFKTEEGYLVFDENEMIGYKINIDKSKAIIEKFKINEIILDIKSNKTVRVRTLTFKTEIGDFTLNENIKNIGENSLAYAKTIEALSDIIAGFERLAKYIER